MHPHAWISVTEDLLLLRYLTWAVRQLFAAVFYYEGVLHFFAYYTTSKQGLNFTIQLTLPLVRYIYIQLNCKDSSPLKKKDFI